MQILSPSDYKIPFDDQGNMLSYPESWKPIEWKENTVFFDTLKYDSFGRGRSAVHIYMVSNTDGRKYTMFMKDFDAIVQDLDKGSTYQGWTYQKRGQNYGLRKATQEEIHRAIQQSL